MDAINMKPSITRAHQGCSYVLITISDNERQLLVFLSIKAERNSYLEVKTPETGHFASLSRRFKHSKILLTQKTL